MIKSDEVINAKHNRIDDGPDNGQGCGKSVPQNGHINARKQITTKYVQ